MYTYMYVRDKETGQSGRVVIWKCVCVCVCIGRGKCGLVFSCLVALEWKVDGNIQSVSRLPRAAVCAIIISTQDSCVRVCVCVSARGELVVTPDVGSSPRS